MSTQIHFEVFARRRSGWALQEASQARTEARNLAQSLITHNDVIEVKVVKETLSEDGTYQSVTIFTAGEKEARKKKAATDKPSIPCFRPQDLHTAHARATISRVLKYFLQEHRVTPMELVHSSWLLEKLEARAATLQGAVQQVAIAMAADSPNSVQEIYLQLMDLCLRAMDRVVQDQKKGKLQMFDEPCVGTYLEQLPPNCDAPYLLSCAIAKHLKNTGDAPEKLSKLLELLDTLPQDEGLRIIGAQTIDQFVAEVLKLPDVLSRLLGSSAEMGDRLRIYANVFLGRSNLLVENSSVLRQLSDILKDKLLPATSSAISNIIIADIKSPKRLHPSDFDKEVDTVRHLAQQLVYGVGEFLSIEDLTEAFIIRSRRLVTPDSIGAYLESAADSLQKIQKLIALEENVIGSQSKNNLAGFIYPLLTSIKFEADLFDDRTPILHRLKTLSDLQASIARSKFEQDDKVELAATIDRLADKVEDRSQFFRQIEIKRIPPAEKALSVLRLRDVGIIPDGSCWDRGQFVIKTQMRKPDFIPSLCPRDLSNDERSERRNEFRRLYDKLEVGVTKTD